MSTPGTNTHLPNTAETQGSEASNISLPVIPESLGKEKPLYNAPVVIHSMGDKTVHGLLRQIDHRDKFLVILRQDKLVRIHFDQVRFLIFSQPIELPADRQKAGSLHQLQNKAFELVFRDKKKFHATAESVFIEPDGIHVFLDREDGNVYRVFAPRVNITHYNLDAQLGKGLVEHRDVETREEMVHEDTEAAEAAYPERRDMVSKPTIVFSGAKHTEAVQENNTDNERELFILPPATNRKELEECIELSWTLPTQHLGDLLVARKVISKEQVNQALVEQLKHPDTYLGQLLISSGIATSEEVHSTLAYKLGMPFVKLGNFDMDPMVLGYFPKDLAVRFQLMPLFLHNDRLVIATSNPTDTDSAKMVEFITGHHLDVVVATREDIESAIDRHYRRREDDEVLEHLGEADQENDELEKNLILEAQRLSKERPIVRLVNNIIVEAVRSRASDIHIRPGEHNVDIILRIDGSLITVRNFSRSIHAAVVSRIKIIGHMDISERRVPQDGRSSINLHGNHIDLRISVMPTVNGESVVIRILDTLAGLRSVEQLGFGERDYSRFKDMINRSYGILLVTGPTGSGKSTTLYAALDHIKKTNVNVITAEDPVEYHIDGIEQMQVNHKTGYTFARILRNILRHDPDVIMVGEIRDQETAKIAIESALTGHLVLSTLHTNSSAVTVTRLLEMGVEPYLINDTLLGVLAQRLVRVNCPHCLTEEEVEADTYEALGVSPEETFYRGSGCEECNYTGYKGRMAVYELLEMTPAIRKIVSHEGGSETIHTQALQDGMLPLTENALNAARTKKTSLAEVYRVRLG